MKLRIGSKLLSVRDDRRLSQAEMADLIGVPTSTYARIERNETSVEIEKLTQFAEKLGMAIQELLPETIAVTSRIDNSGFGGGVNFGTQNFYYSENEHIIRLKTQIEEMKAVIEVLKKEDL